MDYIQLLNRHKERQQFIDFIEQSKLTNGPKGLYVHGSSGVGKTMFVQQLLKELDCDAVFYNAGDVRNKSTLETINTNNMGSSNVLSLFKHKRQSRIVIVMDNIESMNHGDKSGLNTLIKLVRSKLTRKKKDQDNNETTLSSSVPIICIGNECQDKKIKELMKACHVIHLTPPTFEQMKNICATLMPSVEWTFKCNDLRKLMTTVKIFKNDNPIDLTLFNELLLQTHNDDSKRVAHKLLHQTHTLDEHSTMMNETERTMVGLLLHENCIDLFNKTPTIKSVPPYLSALNNWCIGDYYDRITYQKQLWQLNEMTSIIKSLKTHHLFAPVDAKLSEIRFTKVLTKYSAECNNAQFIYHMCQELLLSKDDLLSACTNNQIDIRTESITKLDIQRLQKLMHTYESGLK